MRTGYRIGGSSRPASGPTPRPPDSHGHSNVRTKEHMRRSPPHTSSASLSSRRSEDRAIQRCPVCRRGSTPSPMAALEPILIAFELKARWVSGEPRPRPVSQGRLLFREGRPRRFGSAIEPGDFGCDRAPIKARLLHVINFAVRLILIIRMSPPAAAGERDTGGRFEKERISFIDAR